VATLLPLPSQDSSNSLSTNNSSKVKCPSRFLSKLSSRGLPHHSSNFNNNHLKVFPNSNHLKVFPNSNFNNNLKVFLSSNFNNNPLKVFRNKGSKEEPLHHHNSSNNSSSNVSPSNREVRGESSRIRRRSLPRRNI